MIRRPSIWLLLIIFFHHTRLEGQPIQRYNTFSYNVNEGLLQSTIGQLAIDKNNFCWLSFPNGIQQFDGNSFKTVKIQPGLPDDKHTKFFRCANGDLLVSHSKGISKYEIEADRFVQLYQQEPTLQRPVYFIGEDEGIIYFFDESATISGINSQSFKVTSSVKTGLASFTASSENIPRPSDNIIDHKVAFWIGEIIYLWDLQKKKLVSQSPALPACSPFFLHLLPGEKVLYTNYTDHDAIQCWDFATSTKTKRIIEGKDKVNYISRFIMHRWRDKYLAVINERVYETDSTFSVLRSELVNFQNQPVANNVTIGGMVEDNFGNLYLQTVTGGIRKIIRNNYPFRYYGSLRKEENAVIGILPDKKNNRVLVGTSNAGLYIFDTMQRLIKHLPKIGDKKASFGPNSIIKDNSGDYHLFIMGETKAWKLSSDLSVLTHYPINYPDTPQYSINYFGNPVYRDDSGAVVQSMYQLYRMDFTGKKTTAYRISGEYTLGRLWVENKVVYHANNELIFLDGKTFKEIKKIPFPNTGGVRSLANDNSGHILLGTNKGIFRIDMDGKIIYHWNKEKGLPDECIYAIAVDRNDHIWCSSNKGIFRIDEHNNIIQFTKEDGLQENEFNTQVVAAAEDGELFFGGMNGVSSFYPSAINRFDEKMKMLFTRIRVNNEDLSSEQAVWNVDKLKLRYNQNSLSFDFVAMANNNPSQYIYQYRMEGLDKEWIQVSGLQTVRYSLPPGRYTFQVYASRSFDKDAKPMKEIRIIIQPPFWKSWWFRVGLAVALVSLLTYTINQANKRKYAKHLMQLEHEKKIKEERERISKDLHDSLGAYANAVLYNSELLEKEKGEQKRTELIGGLKFASKDIITSLRETVWALKKESYTAEDSLVRIRNFIQPFTRYYEHISFRVNGEAPPDRLLHYTTALNLVRIVQEAISNSIKHAKPTLIQVTSSYLDDQWKLVITDNGAGFDYDAARKTEQGNGLHNMEHRAAEAGFDLKLETKKGAGTTITIIV